MTDQFVEGLRKFRAEAFPKYKDHYARLVSEGQRPSTLFIGCADSRVVPELLLSAEPGELFMLRNAGNFVPPFEGDTGYHGNSAGIEFAVLQLGVKNIVVCGHTHCGAIRALYSRADTLTPHIEKWLSLARDAMLDVPEGAEPDEATLRQVERRSIVLQMSRLLSYPMVRERVESGAIALHGWHYVIEEGRVLRLSIDRGEFEPLD